MIKKYLDFIVESKSDIDLICSEYGIENYIINSDGTIDVDAVSYTHLTLPTKA